jgi:hypothetical protein
MNLLHVIYLFLIVGAVTSLMMVAGLAKSALEPKRKLGVCPSCGRALRDCRCAP